MSDQRAAELMAAGAGDVVRHQGASRLPALLERELREVIDAGPIGIAICHGDHIAYVNRALVAFFGDEPPRRFVGTPVAELARAEERPRVLARLAAADDGPPLAFGFARSDGTPGTMELSGQRRLVFGGLPSMLLTLRDVTEERRRHERLQMADRMAALGTLAAGIAHEINNPLACVTANLEVLKEELAAAQGGAPACMRLGPDEVLAAIDDARQGAERVRLIVRDLKLFARADPNPRHGPVDLGAVLATAERMTASLMRERAHLVQEHAPLPPVYGDALDLCQVFVNLLANAAQAIEPGAPADNEVRVCAVREGDRVRVEVHDTGAGVPAALRSRIFDAFFTTKGVGGGQGLGLSVCHGIVTSLGGEIAVRAGDSGRGTVVSVALPLWESPAP
jgi:signal transduction histidine kinase